MNQEQGFSTPKQPLKLIGFIGTFASQNPKTPTLLQITFCIVYRHRHSFLVLLAPMAPSGLTPYAEPTAQAHSDLGPYLNHSIWVLAALAGTLLGLRLYSKLYRHRSLWWDDYILITAWVRAYIRGRRFSYSMQCWLIRYLIL